MIGISVYPLLSTVEENLRYIEKAYELGYRRIFSSILELDQNKEKALEQVNAFKEVLNKGKNLGMKVFIDVNPEVLKIIDINPQDFSFFKELGATALRLDSVVNGFYESMVTFNKEELDIEINGSFDSGYLNSIVDLKCNKEKLYTCHNFYPEEHTGLSMETFMNCHKRHKELGLNTAAFVNATKGGKLGPWPANDGLPTIEEHRNLPIDLQAQELYALGIDDIIIGNAFATDEELEALAKVDKNIIVFEVNTEELDDIEEGFFNRVLQNRWDNSSFVARDFMGRKTLKNTTIKCKTEGTFLAEEGTILINNDGYCNYKGELILAIKDITCDTRRNAIGRITKEYRSLIKYIEGGSRFMLVKKRSL